MSRLVRVMRRSAVIAAVVAGIGAGGAEAATYTQYVCRAGSALAPADGFALAASGGTFGGDACLSGGNLTAGLSSRTSSTFVSLGYTPPADVTLVGLTVDRFTRNVNSGSGAIYELRATTDRCDPASGCSGLSGQFVQQGSLSEALFRLGCPSSGCVGQVGVNNPELIITSAQMTLGDDFRPTITVPPSTEGEFEGLRTLFFEATDRGGGIYEAELLVDGVQHYRGVPDDNNGSCKTPFVKQVPCKLAVKASVPFDTTKVSNGQRSLTLNVYDATGENVATYGPVMVTVDNPGAPPAPPVTGGSDGAPQTTAARIVPARAKRLLRRGASQPTVAQGKLVDANGAPVPGAPVQVLAALDVPGAKEKALASATTGADGTYRIVVPPGPSRRISVRAEGAEPWRFRTRVPAPIRVLPSRKRLDNGEKLVLSAYLNGQRRRAWAADVAFQVKIGRQWRTFARKAFDKRGLAQVAHRFKVTFQRMTYRFRAVALKRRRFPFENAASPVVPVRVN